MIEFAQPAIARLGTHQRARLPAHFRRHRLAQLHYADRALRQLRQRQGGAKRVLFLAQMADHGHEEIAARRDLPPRSDATSAKPLGTFETQVAYYMPGPRADSFPGFEPKNHAPHFVGQRMQARLAGIERAYTVEMWFYNSMPADVRPVTGYLFSCRSAGEEATLGEHLAIGGTDSSPGKLVFHCGDRLDQLWAGTTDVPLRNWEPKDSWHHVVLVRDGDSLTVYLDGNPTPDISGQVPTSVLPGPQEIFLGGRPDNFANFEGRIDEVAVYPRALPVDEIVEHYRVATGTGTRK